MKMSGLLKEIEYIKLIGNTNAEIKGIAINSSKIKNGDAFFCIKGQQTDGHKFAKQAEANGAAVIFSERELDGIAIPVVVVKDTLKTLSKFASAFYKYPQNQMIFFGITGTNGKTTSTILLNSILKLAGKNTALFGTIEHFISDKKLEALNTTPLSHELLEMLAFARKFNVKEVVMEVSSHGIALHRVRDIKFKYAGFTNFSQDHLLFHKTMKNYFETKQRFFSELPEEAMILTNIDDDKGMEIVRNTKAQVFTYSLAHKKADFYLKEKKERKEKMLTELIVNTPRGSLGLTTYLKGEFNISNVILASGLAILYGIDFESIQQGILNIKAIPGRLELVDNKAGVKVFVDYAHTPDGFKKVLSTLRAWTDKHLICVFGCGGCRDKEKRPVMGKFASTICDYVIITNDNPRDENEDSIIQDILQGINKENFKVIKDRKEAIKFAIRFATNGDIVAILGRGHEKYQIFAGKRKVEFKDADFAREVLNTLDIAGDGAK